MSRARRLALALRLCPLVMVASVGLACLPLGFPEEIRCESDEHCPFDSWCGLEGRCVPGDQPLPGFAVDGVATSEAGPFEGSAEVPRGRSSDVVVRVRYEGEATARNVRVISSGDDCLGADDSDIEHFEPGAAEVFALRVAPSSDCTSPATYTITVGVGGFWLSEDFELVLVSP